MALLIIQYVFVNLIFTTTTQNIVIMKDLSAPFFSLLIMFFWICGDLAKHGKWELPKLPIVPVMVIALTGWVVNVIMAPVPAAGVEEWTMMAAYFVQVWALIRFADSPKRIENIMLWIVITNAFIAIYGFSQHIGEDLLVNLGFLNPWGQDILVSTHGNQNFLAGYLVTSVTPLIGYWMITRNPFMIVTLPFLVLLNAFLIIQTDARGAIIGLFATIFLLVVLYGINFRNLRIFEARWRKILFKIVGIIIVIALLVGAVVGNEVVVGVYDRVMSNYEETATGLTGFGQKVRLIFWQMAIDGGRLDPIFGRGMGNFNNVMPEVRPPFYHRYGVSHNTMHAHNEWFEWFIETGVFGLSLFLWVMFAFLWDNLKALYNRRKGFYYPLLAGVILGSWAVWIQSLFDVETRWTGNAVTLWFTVGLAIAFVNLRVYVNTVPDTGALAIPVEAPKPKKGKVRAKPEQAYTTSPYLPTIAVIMGCLVAFYTLQAWRHWKADYHLARNMRFTDYGQGTPADGLAEAKKAISYHPSNVSSYYKLAYSYLVSGQPHQALAAYRALQALAPNYAQIHVNLAYLTDQMGYKYSSAWERERAAEIEYNARNLRDAGLYWMNLQRQDRAIPYFRHALSLTRDRIDAIGAVYWIEHDAIYLDLARIYLAQNRIEQALAELKNALLINPSNINAASLLIEVLRSQGNAEEANRIITELIQSGASSPYLSLITAQQAVANENYNEALQIIRTVVLGFPLPAPGAQPSNEVVQLGNTSLNLLQTILNNGVNPAECFFLAGYVYATQNNMQQAERFLSQAYQLNPSDEIAQALGMIKARTR